MSLQSFTLPAYAKINWTLHVGGRRPEGYHELRTVFQTITLHDRLTFSGRDDKGFALTSTDQTIPVDEGNLIWRAALALKERFKVERGAAVHLEKHIPAEAGLGGGSSDAAVTLMGLARLWRVGAAREELAELGAQIGADVPFFFTGGTALGTGLGTEIQPLPDVEAEHLLIVMPRARVRTADAYKALKRPALTKESPDIILSISCAEALFSDSLHEALHNDFEPVIYERNPEIARARRRLIEEGARGALLAGSGASVFAIFDNSRALGLAREALEREPGWRVFEASALSRRRYCEALEAPCDGPSSILDIGA